MRHRTKIAAGAAALLAIGGAGGAVAALNGSAAEESDAIVEDAAAELGVSAEELRDALEKAYGNRIDEAVEEGRLSEERAAELKERIAEGALPLHGPGHAGGYRAAFLGLETAGAYLGLQPAELRERLHDGDSLADLAREEGKSVDGLVDVLVTAAEKRLNEAVEDGRLSEEREAMILENVRESITAMVNGEAGPPGFRGHRGPHHGAPGAGLGADAAA